MRLRVIGQMVFLLASIAMRVVSVPTANMSYGLLAGYALLGRSYAIQALALSWLFTMLNPGIGPEGVSSAIGRYGVIAAAAVSVLWRSLGMRRGADFRVNRLVLVTLLLGGGFVLHTLFISPIRDVSLLKAVSWTITFATLLSAWSGLAPQARQQLEYQLFVGLTVLMLTSLPLLGTNLGFRVNGTGFQGVLNHPQAFGPVMALLAAWLGSRILAEPRPPWYLVGLFGLALVLIVMSEARTAGLGLVLGLGVAMLIGRHLARRRWRDFLPGLRSTRVRVILALALIGALVTGPFLAAHIENYLTKRNDNVALADMYEASRGALIDRMLENVREHPWTGIGFGIASYPEDMDVARDPVLGLPTGAAVEKGMVFLAVLEELGIFGLLSVLAWLWMLVRRTARNAGMTALAVCLTALFMNFGESVLFSPGGMGMLSLILIAWAATGHHALRAEGADA